MTELFELGAGLTEPLIVTDGEIDRELFVKYYTVPAVSSDGYAGETDRTVLSAGSAETDGYLPHLAAAAERMRRVGEYKRAGDELSARLNAAAVLGTFAAVRGTENSTETDAALLPRRTELYTGQRTVYGAGTGMEDISRFFERDSRRYAGDFELFR